MRKRFVKCKSRMQRIFPVLTVLPFLLNMVCTGKNMFPPHLLNSSLTCRLVGGLTRDQRSLCHEAPDAASVAFDGLQLAIRECQHQFKWHRWNCSSLTATNPHSSSIMKRGFRESAFLYALTSAGVAHAIARACAQGRLLSCACDPAGYRPKHHAAQIGSNKEQNWEWSGCSHNLNYGMEFSRKFLDAREKMDDPPSKINKHNNEAGREILSSHMEVRCKCHGVSGSCQLRTCWRATPDFRVVASTIKRKYRKALKVAQEELNNGLPTLRGRPQGRDRACPKLAPKTSLLFYENSPTFCEADPRIDSYGTRGRICRVGGRVSRSGSCDPLCCGRGHAIVKKSTVKPCNCTFHWCCRVQCQRCPEDKWVAICK